MDLRLSPELNRFVSAEVSSGRSDSPDQVIAEALQLLQAREQERRRELSVFETELMRRTERLDAGHVLNPSEARTQLAHYAAERRPKLA